MSWWAGLMAVSAVVLFATCLVLKIREWGFSPLRELARLRRRPWFEAALLALFAGGLVQYGSTKGTDGADRSQLVELMRKPAPTVVPSAADLTGLSLPADFPAITNLCLWGIACGDEAVSLGIAWPADMSFTNGCIDVFGSHRLASNGWWRLAQLDVREARSNAVVELAYADLPTNAMRETAFYRLASQDDSDGDRLSDKVEEWVLGTDPASPDTDDDGLADGEEVEEDADPMSVDSDGDGLNDGDEIGYIRVADGFVWHDTGALTPAYGFAYDSSGPGFPGLWFQWVSQPIQSVHLLGGLALVYLNAFEPGYIAFNAAGDPNHWTTPPSPRPLHQDVMNSGSILTAAYWNNSCLCAGDTNSYIKAGTVGDGSFVVEFHDVRDAPYSPLGMTYQVIVPPGTGNVIRVSYLSSDWWMDGEGAVVGVQNKRIVTTNGHYNLTWNFRERGPILSRTTVEYHLGYGTSPSAADSDADGLDDGRELLLGTDPTDSDSDDDGLSDGAEISLGTAPKTADTDGDGLKDGWEAAHGLDPLSSTGDDGADGDIDGDGLSNLQEQTHGGNPRSADTDGDGLDDAREVRLGTSLSLSDTDRDGLSDGLENSLGLNPLQPDTDGDGLNDGWEYRHRDAGFDPAVDGRADGNPDNDLDADPDGDGLTNGQECAWGTDPANADFDGDGTGDGAEVGQNGDPADPSDGGRPDSRIPVPFTFGDPSGSHSEKYCLAVTPVSGTGERPSSFSWVNANYGECETVTAMLKPGWRYEVRLTWTACNHPHDGKNYPNYDYTLSLGQDVPPYVLLNDPDVLFRSDYYGAEYYGASHFPILDSVATITVYEVTDVTVCRPDGSSWAGLEESRVVLDDEALRIKVGIAPQVKSLAQCRQMFGDALTVATSGTCPSGASVPVGDDATLVNSSGKSELRISKTRAQLAALGLLPAQDDDGVDEMASYDVGAFGGNDGSDLSDCLAFEQMALASRGRASNERMLTLDSDPPNSELSKSFFQAAGAEILSVTYGGVRSAKRQIMNQADYFYYSGHGLHRWGTVDDFGPDVVSDHWKRDLDCVIFAGCSVLDINDYNNNFLDPNGVWDPEDHAASPGKLWAEKGPNVLLGYNYSAPRDSSRAPERIMRSWLSLRQTRGDVDAWMEANDNKNGRNACAIVKDRKYIYWKRILPQWYRTIEVRKENW